MSTDTEPPVTVPVSEFSCDRRRADGSRSFWATDTTETGCTITRWDVVDGAWAEISTRTERSWMDTVQADTELITVCADQLTEFHAPDGGALLDLLTLAGDDDPSEYDWTVDVDDWESEDEDFRFEEGQVRRYARVNGQRVQFIQAEDATVAILADDDLVGGEQIAELIWNNGGDPASGALFAVRAGVAIGLERSESRQEICGFRHDTTPAGVAAMLQAWLSFADGFGSGGGAAAIALEKLDPKGLLNPEQRQTWEEALWEQRQGWDYTFRVSFDVSASVKDELREVFATTDAGYVTVRDALTNPIEGDWLREQLSEGITEALW